MFSAIKNSAPLAVISIKKMKTILIIYPHWHPANLAGVHRPRLIGNFLHQFGWKPRVLTVEARFFEETPDPDFQKTFSPKFDVTRVKALPVMRPRLIGDIGLRAFYQLYKAAREIIRTEQIDFIWLPIPSFYNALLGRLLYDKTGIPYGIDYIDPWVRDLTNQKKWRTRISLWVAKLLEPIAVKKASLISGVSYPYYEPVIKRNFPSIAVQLDANGNNPSPLEKPNPYNLNPNTYNLTPTLLNPHTNLPFTHVAMPYGFDRNDHHIKLENLEFPWESTLNSEPGTQNLKIWLYAGAFLPNSHVILQAFFMAIKALREQKLWDETIRLWFIGTGNYPAKSIESYANDNKIDDIVTEKRDRYPFLQVLNFLNEANTVMIIGSTEKHYTASKTFQSLLSNRPVISAFHHESSAIQVMEDCKADEFTMRYKPKMSHPKMVDAFKAVLQKRLESEEWNPDLSALDQYSAKESARMLVEGIERVI